MLILWLKFIIAAVVVVFSGHKICIYAEKIAQLTRVGRTFIGLMLLAVVTSLPELAVTITATKIHALDLALGDLFGSNLFNLTIVPVILFFFMRKPKLLSFDSTHVLSSAISVLLIALAAMGILFYNFVSPQASYSRFLLDAETALILATYFCGTYLIFRCEKKNMDRSAQSDSETKSDGLRIWLQFLFFAVILLGSAIYLSRLGNIISRIPVGGVALGGTFVGGLFLAVTTSLPEMSVSVSAVKLGFFDMALGNIFGSNMFNIAIIGITDLVLGRTVILSSVSALHLFTVLSVIICTCLVMAGLVYRSKNETSGLAWDSAGVLFIYFAANLVSFYLR